VKPNNSLTINTHHPTPQKLTDTSECHVQYRATLTRRIKENAELKGKFKAPVVMMFKATML
jgi:hypothetical protein